MSQLILTPQSIATFFAKCVIYVPRGFLLPILRIVDSARDLLEHENVPCAFCEHKVTVQRNAKSRLTHGATKKFESLNEKLSRLIVKGILFHLWLIAAIFPENFLNAANNILHKICERIATPFNKLTVFLQANQHQVVWFFLLPLAGVLGAAWLFGIGIVPELYAFMVASFWGGAIINRSANILVYRQKSDEWKAMVKLANCLGGNPNNVQTSHWKSNVQHFGKRLAIELTLLHFIGKIPQFVGYCFQAFFSWLFFYVMVKTAANEMPKMMNKFEQRLRKHHPEPVHYSHRLDNAMWVVTYNTFKLVASNKAQKQYAKLHQRQHEKEDMSRDKRLR